MESKKDKSKYWVIGGIVISWATIWIFITSPFGFLLWLGILGYLITKKSNLKWYLLLSAWIFVPGCNFVTGSLSYFTGNAKLMGVGGPSLYHGIDRETRVPSTSSGCIVLGFEPFVFIPNNGAVRFWTNMFGYQSGAYEGIFPTEEESLNHLINGDTVNVNQTDEELRFTLKNREYEINLTGFYGYGRVEQLNKIVGINIDDECLIIECLSEDEWGNIVFIIDNKEQKILTQYYKRKK